MRGRSPFVLGVLVLAAAGRATAGTGCGWEPGPTFPGGPRKGAGAADLAGTLVVAGGRPWVGSGAAVHFLVPGATSWQAGLPLGEMIMHPAVGLDGQGGLVIAGGYTIEDHYPYFAPIVSGLHYDLAAGPGDGIRGMQHARAFFAATSDTQGRLYVIGGMNVDRVPTPFVERYDPAADAWTTLASLPEPLQRAAAVDDGLGHILVVGGLNAAGSAQATVHVYGVADDAWSPGPAQPAALCGQAAARGADGRVYLAGGSTGATETTSVYTLEPASGTWTAGPSLAVARSDAAVALRADGFLYVMGGYAGTLGTDTVERLDTRPPGPEDDCNGNGVADTCDIASGSSADDNGNGVPDECDPPPQPGDLNCDGRIDFDDIEPFVLALNPLPWYEERYPQCDRGLADVNADGAADFDDIEPFVVLLAGSGG